MVDEDDSEDFKAGPRQPPKAYRFKKEKSGNPRGRPRKLARAYMPVQIISDVLKITEGTKLVRTARGVKRIPTFLALLKAMEMKALSNHGPSLRYLINLHMTVLEMYAQTNPNLAEGVRNSDSFVKDVPRGENVDTIYFFANLARKRTQKI